MENIVNDLSLDSLSLDHDSGLEDAFESIRAPFLREVAQKLYQIFMALSARLKDSSSSSDSGLLEDVKAKIFVARQEILKLLEHQEDFSESDMTFSLQEITKLIIDCERDLRRKLNPECTCEFKLD